MKIIHLLSVDLLKHAFLAKEVQAILDELRLHSDTHTEGALDSLYYPTYISDLLASNTWRDCCLLYTSDAADE